MSFRLLADDGSIHAFPDGTDSRVMLAALSRYHAGLQTSGTSAAAPVPGPSSVPPPTPVPSDLGPNSAVPVAHNGRCLTNVKDFMDAHLADARQLAAMAPGLSPQAILAVSGNESGFDDPARQTLARYGNYFGLHNASSGPFPGQIATHVSALPPHSPTPIFPLSTGFMDSGRAFLNREAPDLTKTILSDPASLFATLHNNGYAVTPEGDKSYVKNMLNVYGLLGNCLQRGPQ